MGLFSRFFRRDTKNITLTCTDELIAKVVYKELALQTAINLISRAIGNSEFMTYERYKRQKADNYYLLNIEPNKNQNASEFWDEVISHLIYDGDTLIFQKASGELMVADSFLKNVVNNHIVFTGISKDNYSFNLTKKMSEVIYLKLNNKNIRSYIDLMYSEYGEVLSKIMNDYKIQNGKKLKVKIGSLFSQKFDDQKALQDFIQKKIEPIFKKANAAIPVEEGFDVSSLETGGNTSISFDEVMKGIDGAFKYVSMALNIPQSIMKGDLADIKEQTKNFFTWCVDPIAKQIDREFNRKYFKKNNYLLGNYMRTDTSRLEHINIFDVSSSLETLLKIGYTPNEVREKVDDDQVDEKWANKHYLLENYKPLEKGGNESGQSNETNSQILRKK